jgi:hypothetical protein
MKKSGMAILAAGLMLTLISGFDYVTSNKVFEVGKVTITQQTKHDIEWSPLVGFSLIAIGGGLFLYGREKNISLKVSK